MKVHVGTSGYAYKEWKGSFYPKTLPAKQMLHYYGEHLRTVEINNTFYALPKPSALEAWRSDVPADFTFALKAPQQITHRKRLKDVDESLAQLLAVAATLKERLGPVLFQLPPNLKKDAARLDAFLALLPPTCRAALEFRHPSWFDEEIFDLLRAHRAALCVADAEGDLDVPVVATAEWVYLRLRRPDYDDAALKMWIRRVRDLGGRKAFVFFKHEDEGKGPLLAKRFLELAAAPAEVHRL